MYAHIYIYIYIYIYTRIRTRARTHTHTYSYVRVCMYACVGVMRVYRLHEELVTYECLSV